LKQPYTINVIPITNSMDLIIPTSNTVLMDKRRQVHVSLMEHGPILDMLAINKTHLNDIFFMYYESIIC